MNSVTCFAVPLVGMRLLSFSFYLLCYAQIIYSSKTALLHVYSFIVLQEIIFTICEFSRKRKLEIHIFRDEIRRWVTPCSSNCNVQLMDPCPLKRGSKLLIFYVECGQQCYCFSVHSDRVGIRGASLVHCSYIRNLCTPGSLLCSCPLCNLFPFHDFQ